MNQYRHSAPPITRSWAESLIKEIDYRFKGTETFWIDEGAESVMALRTAAPSEEEQLAEPLATRTGSPF